MIYYTKDQMLDMTELQLKVYKRKYFSRPMLSVCYHCKGQCNKCDHRVEADIYESAYADLEDTLKEFK